ncbi:biliverdin-producing heme oxygenase [Qipengyuania sphaerica]|uniref:biliverdin-producing heme oxygenase n=1 Tax=Qipengyuania sphaerica TaxID=2867243 RepID=UPI001C8AEBE4|nr:biliverdin-producing heme oxygenase [Qipengyuania sphaerica]MBX7542051.1 biliverdin-producing heme oxygenase [Qipengyuania sphaerica]
MREQLRQATGDIHARLDRCVGHLPMASDDDYSAFLSAQYVARREIEAALGKVRPADLPDLPGQAHLIAQDLQDLGCEPPRVSGEFAINSPDEALGAAWVLAGSSLGNRAMLAQRRKRDLDGPVAFLADKGLGRYFGKLLEVLSRPHGQEQVEAAIRGARAAFARFEQAFAIQGLEEAA